MKNFTDLPLLPSIQKSLEAIGFTEPTEIQAKAIPLLLDNPKSDMHAQAQTGTGKTLAFGIPLLHKIDTSLHKVQCLVVAPTRELVLQIYESLRDVSAKSGVVIEPIYGGMSIQRQIDALRRGAQIVVGTPGRLNDHLRRNTLSLSTLKVLVLDEADIMLDMGFREEVESILVSAPKDRQIWLFSATTGHGINQLIASHMKNVLTVKASSKGVVTPQVKQYYCVVGMRKRIEALTRFVEASPDFYGIVFCQTKVLASEVTEQLTSRGFRANSLHGDMKQALRNQVIKGFKNKDFTILVATDVAARGIDVNDLTHVINFSLPEEHESYVHRIGRTGRAGKEGIAITFISPSETYRVKRLERSANTTLQEIPVPPIEAIISLKMGAVSDFIEQAKQSKSDISPVRKALLDIVESFSESETRQALAAALERTFFKDIIHEDLTDLPTAAINVPKEICLEVGQEHGFNEDDIRSYLYPTCNLLPQEVGKVRVLRNRTFISIPENRMTECLKAMQNSPLTKDNPKVYLVDNVFSKDRRSERSPQRRPSSSRRRR